MPSTTDIRGEPRYELTERVLPVLGSREDGWRSCAYRIRDLSEHGAGIALEFTGPTQEGRLVLLLQQEAGYERAPTVEASPRA